MISARLTLAVYLLAATAGATLYQTSYAVDEVRGQIVETERQIVAEQENIQVLGAEWTYLTEPSRIEALAAKYLRLETTKTQRVAALHDMNRVTQQVASVQPPLIAPLKDTMAEPTVASTPTAAVRAIPVVIATIKPVVTASRAVSPMLAPVSKRQASAVQSTTPSSVKLLLASFQTR